MRVAIMQPYFLPYLGYFQLIGAVDAFVLYDNIKYTKKGWINRNRMLCNGSALVFTLPLAHASDAVPICDRRIAPSFDRSRLLNRMRELYRRAPYAESAFECISQVINYDDDSLFGFVSHSIRAVCEYIGINTQFLVSSSIQTDHALKGADKVLAICNELGADTYINPIGGTSLYARDDFSDRGIALNFLVSNPVTYEQFDAPFVPSLSILDVMMFNGIPQIRRYIDSEYALV